MAEQEIDRVRCVGDDETPLAVIEYRHARWNEGAAGRRLAIGARRWALSSGEPVRYLDAATFEVVATGELLRRIG